MIPRQFPVFSKEYEYFMEQKRLFPAKMRILSGSVLKLIAVITMLIDHIASHLVPKRYVLFSVFGFDVTLYRLMRDIGRIAFPLFVFLLIEGFLHTRSRRRYGVSLLICAVISEVPWDLVHSGEWIHDGQNVFFTLVFGFIGLCAIDSLKKHPFLACCVLITIGVGTLFAKADYGIFGYAFILLMYGLRQQELLRPFTALLLNNHWFCMAAFVPMFMYNGKRGFIKGPVLKYAFYLFYPVHLFIIFLIKYDYIRI